MGFGAWAIGGEWRFGWGPQDDADSIAAIRQAVSRGVNWIDTAPAYGLGHSEEVVAMRRKTKNPQIHRLIKKGATHFDILAPANEMVAKKIQGDTGPKCNIAITEEEMDALK